MTDVHIVSVDTQSDTILGRLVKPLIYELGWSYGEVPSPGASANYFFPYLQWKVGMDTKSVAWFTHFDAGRREKELLWERANGAADYRTVCAWKYAAMLTEPLGVITPPIQLDKFTPGPQRGTLVGTSGYVYPYGRKGERLYARLRGDRALQHARFVAAGRGWLEVPTTDWPWERMEEFYRSLALYVCTSTIEGTGHGPLEALACGVPVVVPVGVGVFDELPDSPAVTRYVAGDYASLAEATRVALRGAGRVDGDEARSLVLRFTEEAWLQGHVDVMDDVLGRPTYQWGEPQQTFTATVNMPETMNIPKVRDRGVYVVAFGDPSRDCASRCIRSWGRYMPSVPVTLASDKLLGPEDHFVEARDADIGGRSVKTRIYDLAPRDWKYVVYVDADTELVAPVDFLFQLLEDGWDMFICLNAVKFVVAGNMKRPDNRDECQETYNLYGTEEILQFNGGVFGFARNKRTSALIRAWHEEWDRYGKRDQAALLRALHANPVKLVTLGVEWNTVTRYYPKERSAGIVHYPMTARRWKGIIHGRSDSEEAWEAAR